MPLVLRLYNFLSYRGVAELDLRQVHVACLCGDNGHGKSALLDAITWALMGWARGRRYGQGGHSPEELVCQGETEMEVSLEFQAGGGVYQVLRKFSRGGRSRSPATVVDLQAATGSGFRSITVGSVADTERRLHHILGMDYETFISSAFLLQGQADRFTTSTPARRKETLAEVLGLGLYERLEGRARERLKEEEAHLLRCRVELERLEAELGRRPDIRASLALAEEALASLLPRLEGAARGLEDARAALRALEALEREAEGLRRSAWQALADAERLEAQAAASRARLQEHRRLLDRRAEAEAGLERLAEARQRLDTLDEAQSRYAELTEQALRLEHAIARERQGIEAEARGLEQRLQRDLKPRAARLPALARAMAETAQALTDLEARSSSLRERRASLDERLGQARWLEAENARLRQEMQGLRRRLDMLTPGQAVCPLCGTTLGAQGLDHLRGEIATQGLALRRQHDDNRERLQALGSEARLLEEGLAREEATVLAERGRLLSRQGALAREREECQAAAAELGEAAAAAAALAGRLQAEDYAREERSRLEAARAELAALAYDAQAHRSARALAVEMEGYAQMALRVREAQARLPQEEAALATLESLQTARRQAAEEAGQRVSSTEAGLLRLPSLRSMAEAMAAEHRGLDAERSRLQGEAHAHRLRLEELGRLEERSRALAEETARRRQASDTCALLAEAFGKRGVQALLIEAALPELEAEANALLARLTDNRMHLTLETQRENRRGDLQETLEIRIADELGTRSYELFSGGEAFRINFALRVALARLLASRSGTPLRTLFLDEGFGTQDAQGRERLLDAIRAIQDDFDLVLVITHIEEMKEAFPVRIEVTRTEAGSALHLIGV